MSISKLYEEENIDELIEKFIKDKGVLKFSDDKENRRIILGLIRSPEKGYGTRAMRGLVKLSLEKGYDGNLELDAEYSSHIFYLLMGMEPIEKLDYVSYIYGSLTKDALNLFEKFEDSGFFEKNYPEEILDLQYVLSNEIKIPQEEITNAMIFENRKLLLDLNDKNISYLQIEFIPKLLTILEENIGNKRPDTTELGIVKMALSPQGRERWIKAIKGNTEFEPFRNFEQLIIHMTNEQIEKFKLIMEVRNPKKITDFFSTNSNNDQKDEGTPKITFKI